MTVFQKFMFSLSIMVLAAGAFQTNSHASSLSTEQRVLLQTAMYQYIETVAVDDVITHVNLDNGEVLDLVPAKAHPMILAFEENYVLCADFINPEGKEIDVDFYVKPAGDGYRVFRMEIGNRKPLKKLMSKGLIQRIK